MPVGTIFIWTYLSTHMIRFLFIKTCYYLFYYGMGDMCFYPLYAIVSFHYMPECNLCGNSCGEPDLTKFGYEHLEYVMERERRRDNGLCVKCTKDALSHHVWCDDCNVNSKYLGYPGGLA